MDRRGVVDWLVVLRGLTGELERGYEEVLWGVMLFVFLFRV